MEFQLKEKTKTKRTVTIKLSESDTVALFDELYDMASVVDLDNRPALHDLMTELGRMVRNF